MPIQLTWKVFMKIHSCVLEDLIILRFSKLSLAWHMAMILVKIKSLHFNQDLMIYLVIERERVCVNLSLTLYGCVICLIFINRHILKWSSGELSNLAYYDFADVNILHLVPDLWYRLLYNLLNLINSFVTTFYFILLFFSN